MSILHRLAVRIYQKSLNKRSFWRKLRFEYTYRINRGFGDTEYHKRIATDIVKNLPKASRGGYKNALDLGCGLGFITARLAEKIPSVTGVDISKAALSIAKSQNSKADFLQRDAIDYCSGRYDLIMCTGILPYIPERESKKIADNIDKMLAKNGTIAIFEKSAYTGTPIEKYLAIWNYPHSKKKVKIAGEAFVRWVVKKP